jgi:hypothetical protein
MELESKCLKDSPFFVSCSTISFSTWKIIYSLCNLKNCLNPFSRKRQMTYTFCVQAALVIRKFAIHGFDYSRIPFSTPKFVIRGFSLVIRGFWTKLP